MVWRFWLGLAQWVANCTHVLSTSILPFLIIICLKLLLFSELSTRTAAPGGDDSSCTNQVTDVKLGLGSCYGYVCCFYPHQGNLGVLDVATRGYTTIMRTHTQRILSLSLDPLRRHLATVSEDHTIRVWDLDTMQQVPYIAEMLGE